MAENKQQIIAHDAKRCPDCDTLGKLVEAVTRPDPSAMEQAAGKNTSRDWEKVRARDYECRGEDCERRWRSYA